MKKPTSAEIALVIGILLVPFVYVAVIYPTLPATIPTHFNIRGEADKFGEKDSLWLITAIMGFAALSTYLLVRFLPNIDPKKTAGQSPDLNRKIAFTVVLFLTCISIGIVRSSSSKQLEMVKFIPPLIGIFFSVLGNYMHSIKPNYFVGFRTPWTLENEDNWRKTHHLVSKIWVPGGLLIAVAALLLPMQYGMIAMLVLLVPMIFVPVVYSYLYYRKHR